MTQKRCRIAVVSDIHFASSPLPNAAARHGEYGDTLLLRAVHRFNRYIRPDAVLVAGDMINDPRDPEAPELLIRLRNILDKLQMPYRVIPGNHDPAHEIFYKAFPEHRDVLDVGIYRILPFTDPETPGNNACRQPEDFERMRQARENWDGELIALQHVPVGPPEDHNCWYNFINANDVLDAMQKYRFKACICGHEHAGMPAREINGTTFICTPGICEVPLSYLIVDIDDDGKIHVTRENLSLDAELKLEDHHVHTTFAYCNENLALPKTRELGQLFGLSKIVYTEHSSHLLFTKDECIQRRHFYDGITGVLPSSSRMADYFRTQQEIENGFEMTGMELDYDKFGRTVVHPADRAKLQFCNGAVHAMDTMYSGGDMAGIKEEFMFLCEAALRDGVQALAHPFRIFSFNGLGKKFPVPEELFVQLAEMLKKYAVAAEINFHCNQPEEEFFALCVQKGVKISLGSDTHNLYEVGEFYPHMQLLDKIAPGWRSNPHEIMVQA